MSLPLMLEFLVDDELRGLLLWPDHADDDFYTPAAGQEYLNGLEPNDHEAVVMVSTDPTDHGPGTLVSEVFVLGKVGFAAAWATGEGFAAMARARPAELYKKLTQDMFPERMALATRKRAN